MALAASRFFPHPPNFTSLIALSFYIPAIFGARYLPALVVSFILTDFIIGFHQVTLFTWGSVLVIGLSAKFFLFNTRNRIFGALIGAFLFYIITNFGVWSSGIYGYNIKGLISCYILAIPFFGNTLLATMIYSAIIESVMKYFKFSKKVKIE
jgi:hypothetical protein